MAELSEELYSQVLGRMVREYLRSLDPELLAAHLDSAAVRALSEIRDILNDPDLDDPSCFLRIDEIVRVFHRSGLSVTRHWEAE